MKTWLFGDVWVSPEECQILASLIEDGITYPGATEGRRAYIHTTTSGYALHIEALILLGHRKSMMLIKDLLDDDPVKIDARSIVSHTTGLSAELISRVSRWYGEGMSAAGIIDKLRAVQHA